MFLAGFVPTENLRFREESLSFKVAEQGRDDEIERHQSFKYDAMTRTQGQFKLTVSKFKYVIIYMYSRLPTHLIK